MRRLTTTVLVLAALVVAGGLTTVAHAQEGPACGDRTDGNGNAIVGCGGGGSGQGNGNGNGGGGGYDGPLVTAVSSVDGQPCTILATPTSDQGAEALAIENGLDSFPLIGGLLGALWDFIVAGLPGCPGGIVSPRDVAFGFVRTMTPPDTRPSIAPGHAVTGKAAFLEQGMTEATQTFATVLGPLTITLKAKEFTVDWGDGSGRDPGPFASPGGPWPDGKPRHTYTEAGTVDVVITQRWVAHWQIPGVEAGDINGVRSTDEITGFEIRQLQAVREK